MIKNKMFTLILYVKGLSLSSLVNLNISAIK